MNDVKMQPDQVKIQQIVMKKARAMNDNHNAIVESYIEANLATYKIHRKNMTDLDMADLIRRASLTIKQTSEGVEYSFKLKPKIKNKFKSRIIV